MLSKERIVGAIRKLSLPTPYQELYPFTHLGIVRLLASYDRPIRVGFIALKVRSTEAEVQQKLNVLQQAGIVTIEEGIVSLLR